MTKEAEIRIVIVDDEAPARTRLRQLLKTEPDFALVGECSNGAQAVETIQRARPDLVFLDVQMPRLNGLEVCQSLIASGISLPMVIFVTAYDDYALKAFEVHAVDYLLKPFDRERFAQALSHARNQLARSKSNPLEAQVAAVLNELAPISKKSQRLVLKENGRLVFVRTETINWIEADGNYLRLHARDCTHYVRETLGHFEAELPPDKFMRISRSVIVNLDRVKELQPLFYGDYSVVLDDGSKLSMSRAYRDRLKALSQRRL